MYTREVKWLLLMAVLMLACVQPVAGKSSGNHWSPLGHKYTVRDLKNIILPREKWHPYPTAQHPEGFKRIPVKVRQAYIRQGQAALGTPWPRLSATDFLEFKRAGDKTPYLIASFGRQIKLAKLVLAEALQHKGRFLNQIVNGIWLISEQSFWGVPSNAAPGLPDVKHPRMGLFPPEPAQLLAWTYYLLKPELDHVDPEIARRIRHEVTRRIFKPYLEHNDWWYLGFQWRKHPDQYQRPNNWDPWINENVLSAALILAPPKMRLKLVHKTMASIDNFVLPYPADGSSDEGPQYWGRAAGGLVDYLETLKSASGGKIDAFNQPVVKKMGRYYYKMYINYPYFVNYGDANAKLRVDPTLLYRLGQQTQDSILQYLAAFEYQQQQANNYHERATSRSKGKSWPLLGGDGAYRPYPYRWGVLNRALLDLKSIGKLINTAPKEPLIRDAWLPDAQIMIARSKKGSHQSFYLMGKGGTNGASHNHNDVGNYIVFYDGQPVLVDAGAHSYSKKTFSSQRYHIWNYESRYHNLPDINGYMQQNRKQAGQAQGRQDLASFSRQHQYEAHDVHYHENNKKAQLTMDLAAAYPRAAQVKSWIRTMTLNRGTNVEINESYSLGKFIKPLAENFLTPDKPDLSKAGVIALQVSKDSKCFISYDKKKFTAHYEKVPINDHRMSSSWGHKLYHVVLKSKENRLHGNFTIKIHN